MATYTVTAPSEDKGYGVRYQLIVARIEGLHGSYGPGGYSLLMIPKGREGRRETGGPMFTGPWGSLFGLASVIDNYGGTAADMRKAIDEGRYIATLADGDRLVIAGDEYVVRVNRPAREVLVLPSITTVEAVAALVQARNAIRAMDEAWESGDLAGALNEANAVRAEIDVVLARSGMSDDDLPRP